MISTFLIMCSTLPYSWLVAAAGTASAAVETVAVVEVAGCEMPAAVSAHFLSTPFLFFSHLVLH